MARRSIEDIRKAELIVAALDVVAEDGHDAATVQRIAARAETSPGIVHHYFGDKHRLMLAAMRAVRKPVAEAYRTATLDTGESGRAALDACIDAHLNASVLTVRRAAVWLQFTARVAYEPDYARIHAAVRCRQVAALRRALGPLTANVQTCHLTALRIAVALDGYWTETATREGGLYPGEAEAAVASLLRESLL